MKELGSRFLVCIFIVSCTVFGASSASALTVDSIEGLPCDPFVDLPVCETQKTTCYCLAFESSRPAQYVCAACPDELVCDTTKVTCASSSETVEQPTQLRASSTLGDDAHSNPVYIDNSSSKNWLFCDDDCAVTGSFRNGPHAPRRGPTVRPQPTPRPPKNPGMQTNPTFQDNALTGDMPY